MLDTIKSPEAHNMARALEKVAHTLFGDVPPQRNDEGWQEYTRAIRLLAGGLPEPTNDEMRLIKDGHNANFDPQKLRKQYAPDQPPATEAATTQRQTPQAATSPGAMSADQLKTLKNEFMTTALRAARLTPQPPNTAPTTEEPNDDSRYEQDAHFFTPRRPDNASSTFVRGLVLNDLRFIWELLAKMLNEYEQILNTAADENDKYDGRRANEEDENEIYKQGTRPAEKATTQTRTEMRDTTNDKPRRNPNSPRAHNRRHPRLHRRETTQNGGVQGETIRKRRGNRRRGPHQPRDSTQGWNRRTTAQRRDDHGSRGTCATERAIRCQAASDTETAGPRDKRRPPSSPAPPPALPVCQPHYRGNAARRTAGADPTHRLRGHLRERDVLLLELARGEEPERAMAEPPHHAGALEPRRAGHDLPTTER